MRRVRRLHPSIAEVVREEMVRQGITQSEVCRRCTVERTALNRWLNGKQGMRVDLAEQVMAVLGIRVVRG